ESRDGAAARMLDGKRGIVVFLATLWLIAYVEEMLWDRTLYHDRPWLFGGGLDVGGAAVVIAPLLAVPQLVHYVLDGLLWRRRPGGAAVWGAGRRRGGGRTRATAPRTTPGAPPAWRPPALARLSPSPLPPPPPPLPLPRPCPEPLPEPSPVPPLEPEPEPEP